MPRFVGNDRMSEASFEIRFRSLVVQKPFKGCCDLAHDGLKLNTITETEARNHKRVITIVVFGGVFLIRENIV